MSELTAEQKAVQDALARQEAAAKQPEVAEVSPPPSAPEPTPPAPQQEEQGFLQTIWNNVSEIPSAIAGGIFNGVAETGQTVANANSMSTADGDKMISGMVAMREKVLGRPLSEEEKAKLANDAGLVLASQGIAVRDKPVDFKGSDLTKALGFELPKPETITGGLTQGISQFITGFALLGGGKTFVGAMLKGAVVDATVFDPYENNLSAFLKENGWAKGAIIDALATDPNATDWENRLKNSLEGGIAGSLLEGIVRGVKFVATSRKARDEIKELGKVTDETAAELDQAHKDAAKAEEAVSAPKDKLTARPDGMFEAPDGSVYKPEGEQLELFGKPPEQQVDAPRVAPEGPKPLTPDEQLRANLTEAYKPVEVAVKPKVPLIEPEKFKAAITRSIEMSDFELRNIDEEGWFNLGKMEGPVEAAKIIDAFQDVISSSGASKAMGLDKPQTHETVIRNSLKYLADNTGTNVNKLVRDLNVHETMSRDMAQRIVAGKMALQTTGREISNLASKIEVASATGKASEDLERQLLDLMQTHVEMQANVKGLQTAAARATAAGRIVTKDVLSADTLDKLAAFGGSGRVRQLAKQLALVSDDAKKSKTIRKAVERKWLTVLNEYWINQILSGVSTHAMNISANTINLVRPAERGIGALFRLDTVEAEKAFKQYLYLGSAFKDAISLAAKAGYNQRPILDEAIKFDLGNRTSRAMSAEYLGLSGKTGTAVDVIGKALTIAGRALTTEDEFFKQLSFRSHLKASISVDAKRLTQADLDKLGYSNIDEFIEGEFEKAFETKITAEERWQEAVVTGRVIDDAEVKQRFIEQTIGAANQSSKYAQSALHEARESTFTTPFQKDTFNRDLQVLANKWPLTRQIIPFIQTPMNVLTAAWDRTPGLNLLRNQYRKELMSTDPTIRAQAAGKLALGVATTFTLMRLHNEGRITGGGPNDPALANLWRNSKDWQPYSINVGTRDNPEWISYARLDPWTTMFGVVGDIGEMVETMKMADSDVNDFIAMTVAAFGNNIMSKFYLQGIADVVTLLDSKDRPDQVKAFFRQRAASMLPYSSFTNQMGQAFDDNLREVRTVLDAFRKQSGIGRGSLPIKYDWVSGQPLETPDKMLGYLNTKKLSPEDEGIALINSEMRKLGYKFGGAERKIAGVTLTPAQYQRWNQLIGSTKVGNKTLSDHLIKVINHPRYDKDADNYNITTPQESHRVQMMNPIISKFRSLARMKLMQEYPELKKAVMEYERYVSKTQAGKEAERPVIDMNQLD
jgi:hypothetical protein